MNVTNALDLILKEFMQIAEIPRPSHHEEKIGEYLLQWALHRGLSAVKDSLGDVIIEKPASPGCESSPRVILQSHMDMVCVSAEGVSYDPLTDPIKVLNDGKMLTADGTSLGADDGIGVALCLYILQETSLRHGPLRVIITVNEEDGMSSIDLENKYLDADYLINLDWEWLGSLCNSSAGADFVTLTRPAGWISADKTCVSMKLQLKGLLGGHSGVDINRGRANGLVCMAAALYQLSQSDVEFGLADFHGGQAKNAIPAFAEAVITMPDGRQDCVRQCFQEYETDFSTAFEAVEPSFKFSVEEMDAPAERILNASVASDLITLLNVLPHNVHTMSPFAATLVESSQNLGLLSVDDQIVTLSAMERSCVSYRAVELLRSSRLIAEALGFTFLLGEHAPAWAVNPKSKLTPLTCQLYKELTGKEMVVEPVHGGLECGAFFEKNPALDMIAIGPSLTDVHSPKESCDLESVQVTAELVVTLLERLI